MSRFTLLFCCIFCYWRNQQSVSESFLRSSSLESSMQYPVPKACFPTGFRKNHASKVTETNESTGSVIQLVWMPLQMEILSTCISVAVKTCKMKQKKKPCPVCIPAWWTFLCCFWAVVYCQGRTLGREPAQQEASLAMNRSKTVLQKEQCPVWATSLTTTST